MAAGAAVPGERHVGLVAEDDRAIRANDKAIDDIGGQAHLDGSRPRGITRAPGGAHGGRGTDELNGQQAGPCRPEPPDVVGPCVQSASLPTGSSSTTDGNRRSIRRDGTPALHGRVTCGPPGIRRKNPLTDRGRGTMLVGDATTQQGSRREPTPRIEWGKAGYGPLCGLHGQYRERRRLSATPGHGSIRESPSDERSASRLLRAAPAATGGTVAVPHAPGCPPPQSPVGPG
jgi:hypothetical protein